jgi:hypothetical protein
MEVPVKYPGQAAVMFATGPSLTKEVVDLIRPYHASGKVVAFGCNDAYKLVDYLDVHYACDPEWWDLHVKEVLRGLPPSCHVWTQDPGAAEKYKLSFIPGFHKPGFYVANRQHIHFGANSGYQQLNLAYHYGIRKFLLVGYNMKMVNNSRHFFGEHPGRMKKDSPYDLFIHNYKSIQPEIQPMIINCTDNSALNCFKKMDLKEALDSL